MELSRNEVLDRAGRAVNGDRTHDYGGPESSFSKIAAYWQAYLYQIIKERNGDLCICGHDVALMLALLKIARLTTSPAHVDSWVDLAGYAACGGEVASGMLCGAPQPGGPIIEKSR